MKSFLALPTEHGDPLLVEVDVEPGIVRSARPGEIVATASYTFEAALAKLKPGAEAVIKTLRGIAESPNEITVELGVKMTAEAGFVIAQGGTEANFRVTLAWKSAEPR